MLSSTVENASSSNHFCSILPKDAKTKDSKIPKLSLEKEIQIKNTNLALINKDLSNDKVNMNDEKITKDLKINSQEIADNTFIQDLFKDEKSLLNIESNNLEFEPKQNDESKQFKDVPKLKDVSKSKKVQVELSQFNSKKSIKSIDQIQFNKKILESNDKKESIKLTKNKTNKINKHSKMKRTSSPTPEAFYDFLNESECQKTHSKTSTCESKFSFCYPSKTKIQKSDTSTKKCINEHMNYETPKISLKFQKCDPKKDGKPYQIYSHDLFEALEEHELRLLKGRKIKARNNTICKKTQLNKESCNQSKGDFYTKHCQCIYIRMFVCMLMLSELKFEN